MTPVNVSRKTLLEDFEIKKFFLLQLTLNDLHNYEALVSFIVSDELLNNEPNEEFIKLKEGCEKFFIRRISFSVKTFTPHRKELDKVISYLEGRQNYELVPFKALLATYVTILPKGGERCEEFTERAQHLLTAARSIENRTKFNDHLIINTPVQDNKLVLEAKVKMITRWILEDINQGMAKSELDKLISSNGTDPSVLILNANYLTQMGRKTPSQNAKKNYIEEAFSFFLKAVKDSPQGPNSCPGLFSEFLQLQSNEWNKLARYCAYPEYLEGFQTRGVTLSHNLCNAIKFIPEKQYRRLAYAILRNMYTYWPAQYEKVMDYNEVIGYERLVDR